MSLRTLKFIARDPFISKEQQLHAASVHSVGEGYDYRSFSLAILHSRKSLHFNYKSFLRQVLLKIARKIILL